MFNEWWLGATKKSPTNKRRRPPALRSPPEPTANIYIYIYIYIERERDIHIYIYISSDNDNDNNNNDNNNNYYYKPSRRLRSPLRGPRRCLNIKTQPKREEEQQQQNERSISSSSSSSSSSSNPNEVPLVGSTFLSTPGRLATSPRREPPAPRILPTFVFCLLLT